MQFKNKIYRLIRLDRTCNSGSSEQRIHISALINLFMNFRCVCLCVCATVVHYTISRYDLTYAHHHIYVCARVCVCVNTLVCVCVCRHALKTIAPPHARTQFFCRAATRLCDAGDGTRTASNDICASYDIRNKLTSIWARTNFYAWCVCVCVCGRARG